MTDVDTALPQALTIARNALQFARVNRITMFEDGQTFESDTDHTVMLGWLGIALAPILAPELDVGRVAIFAGVHDMVEVYAGDTPTLGGLDANARAAKEARELAAIDKLIGEHPRGSSLMAWLHDYEQQSLPEARFIKLLDKITPKLTHELNRCAAVIARGVTKERLIQHHDEQYLALGAQYSIEFPAVLAFLKQAMDSSVRSYPCTLAPLDPRTYAPVSRIPLCTPVQYGSRRGGSVGRLYRKHGDVAKVEWVYGLDVRGEPMTGYERFQEHDYLIVISEAEYNAVATRRGWGSGT